MYYAKEILEEKINELEGRIQGCNKQLNNPSNVIKKEDINSFILRYSSRISMLRKAIKILSEAERD